VSAVASGDKGQLCGGGRQLIFKISLKYLGNHTFISRRCNRFVLLISLYGHA